MNTESQKKCACGRSPTGFCDGLHKLTNEQYKNHCIKEQLTPKPELLKG